jgi:hypothetical protein
MTKYEAIKVLNGSINWDSVPTAKLAWQTLVDYCTHPTANNKQSTPCSKLDTCNSTCKSCCCYGLPNCYE